jgi:protein-tyrosine phosphatase
MAVLVDQCRLFALALWDGAKFFMTRVNVLRGPYERFAPVRLPDEIQSVLFVCKGNICRSPLAEVYFRSVVEKAGASIVISSAGLETTPGRPANQNAKAVASQQTLSLESHATTQIHAELVDRATLIVVMEVRQKQRLFRLYPNTRGKTVLLGYFDSKGPIEIADPYGKPVEQFQVCFEQIRRACDSLAARLSLNGTSSQ